MGAFEIDAAPSLEAQSVASDSFLAVFSAVRNATNYILDVFTLADTVPPFTVSGNFSEWDAYSATSGPNYTKRHEQSTADGVWATTRVTVQPAQGRLVFPTSGSLESPPLDAVSDVSFTAVGVSGTPSLTLAVREPSASDFSDIATFDLALSSETHSYSKPTPFPDGSVFRLLSQGPVRLFDMTFSGGGGALPASTARWYRLLSKTNLTSTNLDLVPSGWGVPGMVVASPPLPANFLLLESHLSPPSDPD